MKKFLAGALLAVSALTLAVGQIVEMTEKLGSELLVVGASNAPHAVILEQVKPLLKNKALNLQLKHIKIMFYQTKI